MAGPESFVDLERYPITDLDGQNGRALIERIRAEMEANCICALPEFLTPQALERMAMAQGAGLRASDLASYRPEWVTPIGKDYRGYTLHEIPPNGQGIAALIALGI